MSFADMQESFELSLEALGSVAGGVLTDEQIAILDEMIVRLKIAGCSREDARTIGNASDPATADPAEVVAYLMEHWDD